LYTDQVKVSIAASIVGMGRMCRHTDDTNAWSFLPTDNTCSPEALHRIVAGVDNATYCIQKVQTCDQPNCQVNLTRLVTFDANHNAESDCQAESRHDSMLYEELIGGNPDMIESEIVALIEKQSIFITWWLNHLGT
jgi:hypothetical protein